MELMETFEFCRKAKDQMKRLAVERATKKCPDCGGRWTFVLAGPKKHLHAACSGPCGGRMME